jgi:hypothetical protein
MFFLTSKYYFYIFQKELHAARVTKICTTYSRAINDDMLGLGQGCGAVTLAWTP